MFSKLWMASPVILVIPSLLISGLVCVPKNRPDRYTQRHTEFVMQTGNHVVLWFIPDKCYNLILLAPAINPDATMSVMIVCLVCCSDISGVYGFWFLFLHSTVLGVKPFIGNTLNKLWWLVIWDDWTELQYCIHPDWLNLHLLLWLWPHEGAEF